MGGQIIECDLNSIDQVGPSATRLPKRYHQVDVGIHIVDGYEWDPSARIDRMIESEGNHGWIDYEISHRHTERSLRCLSSDVFVVEYILR